MNIITRTQTWFDRHPRCKQWAWFLGLWFLGLFSVMALAYPIKMIIHA